MKSLHLVAPDGSMRSTWPLTAGAPFTIGAQGNWCLGRGLLLPVHALVYFDGRTPLVASASQEWPVHLDGRPLPTSWTPLERSCRLTMGPIAIHYVSGDIDPERAAPTAKRRPRARDCSPRAAYSTSSARGCTRAPPSAR